MSRRSGKSKQPVAQAPVRTGVALSPRALGAAFLVVGVAASAFLVVHHFGGSLPGCGPKSGCDALTASAWGRVPGLGWPVSFVGLAWFSALLVAWLSARDLVPPVLAWLARAGAVLSLVFLVAMASLGKLCPFCTVAHAGSLGFALVTEYTRKRSGGAASARPAFAFVAVFVAASLALLALEQRAQSQRLNRAETERGALVERVVASATAPKTEPEDRWGPAGFTGRFRIGPAEAPIRIVILTDYQCPDCKRVEGEVEALLSAHPDVSLSVKHFPMDASCNRHVTRSLHENACWAARAAEAAGILGGDEAFFAMHRWLFSRGGTFRGREELQEGVSQAGLDFERFVAVMEGDETLTRVKEDIDDAIDLGLFFTPMIFVNGQEVKWSLAPADTVTKTVEALAAKGLPPRSAAHDAPPLAATKYVEDWRMQPVRELFKGARSWTRGAAEGQAAVDVVLFGAYGSAPVRDVDVAIRRALETRPGVRYAFRQYPLSPDCNPALPSGMSADAFDPTDCLAARAAEAAGLLGGPSAFWGMHEQLVAHDGPVTKEWVEEAGARIGLEPSALARALELPTVTDAVAADSRAAGALGIRRIPFVFVDGKEVPRPARKEDDVMSRILDDALASAP